MTTGVHVNVSPDIQKDTANALAKMITLVACPIISEHYGIPQSSIKTTGDGIIAIAQKQKQSEIPK